MTFSLYLYYIAWITKKPKKVTWPKLCQKWNHIHVHGRRGLLVIFHKKQQHGKELHKPNAKKKKTKLLTHLLGLVIRERNENISTNMVLTQRRRRTSGIRFWPMKLNQLSQRRRLPLSPTEHHDHHELELPGAWEPSGSLGTYWFGKEKRTYNFVSYGNKTESKWNAVR